MKALRVENLKKIYKNGVVALKGIDLTIEQGDFFALLGPNGAGKSTTIGIITSLVNKTSGKVSVFDYDLDEMPQTVKAQIGLVPQEFNFTISEKVLHILVKQAGFYGIPRKTALERSEKYLKALGIWDKRHERSRFLSGGQKRRLMIARALVHEPPLLILDEPTAGVDIELRRTLWSFLQELNAKGTTIILTTHYLEEAESLCKNIAIIDHGTLIAHDSMSSLLQRLKTESFVLDLREPLTVAPQLNGFLCRLTDKQTLEIDVNQGQKINDVFLQLTKHNIEVISLRNKTNRLEKLFLHLTSKKNTEK